MRERATLLGGSVEIGPNRGGGTTVRVSVPLADRRRAPREPGE
jgi:signal transduction histidine kinase